MDYQTLSNEELVRKCAENSAPDAREEFVRRFHQSITTFVIKFCRRWSITARDVIEELIQDIYVKLWNKDCSLLAHFASQHENAFLGYLKKVALSVVYDRFRREKPIDDKTTEFNETVHESRTNYGTSKAAEMVLFSDEIDRLLREEGYSTLERTIFWLYYREGYTAREIAAIPACGLTTKGLESLIHRMTEYVRRSMVLKTDAQSAGK